MYTLTRAAHVRPAAASSNAMNELMDERADRENYINLSQSSSYTDTDSCDDSQDESSMIVFKVPAGPNNAEATVVLPRKNHLRKRQPKITGKSKSCDV